MDEQGVRACPEYTAAPVGLSIRLPVGRHGIRHVSAVRGLVAGCRVLPTAAAPPAATRAQRRAQLLEDRLVLFKARGYFIGGHPGVGIQTLDPVVQLLQQLGTGDSLVETRAKLGITRAQSQHTFSAEPRVRGRGRFDRVRGHLRLLGPVLILAEKLGYGPGEADGWCRRR